jgi:DNA-binding transcriptional MerR regulator
MSELIDARELARRWQVTVETVRGWHRRGWIPCIRDGRRLLFDVDAVEKASRERSQARGSAVIDREVGLALNGTPTARQILESLDAAEISKRLDEIEHEREALRVLYRAALRIERQKSQVPKTK